MPPRGPSELPGSAPTAPQKGRRSARQPLNDPRRLNVPHSVRACPVRHLPPRGRSRRISALTPRPAPSATSGRWPLARTNRSTHRKSPAVDRSGQLDRRRGQAATAVAASEGAAASGDAAAAAERTPALHDGQTRISTRSCPGTIATGALTSRPGSLTVDDGRPDRPECAKVSAA